MRHALRGAFIATTVACTALPLVTCATNPATGQRQLALVSESQEISMGQQYAQEVMQTMAVYPDSEVQRYVNSIGQKIAALTERPNLPWKYTVLDDPVVNAFALPGGPIFITRGILTHMNSEAELASVLGHETGHVTARHSVQQLSRAQLAQVGLGVGSILSSDVAKLSGALSTGLGILFLKYSRSDEDQADALGFRYSYRANYDVRQMANMFVTLERVSQLQGGRSTPEWLSTHPNPGNRVQKTEHRVDSLNADLSHTVINREGYLRHIDGMIYGDNPRQGFFQGSTFRHPDLKFEIEFPQGWATQNQPQAVVAVSQQQDAILQLTMASGMSPDQAMQKFLSQEGVQAGQASRTSINGNPAVTSTFAAQTDQGQIQGRVTYLSYGGATYQLLGYTTAQQFSNYDRDFSRTMGSFRRLTDQAALNAQPMRIQLVKLTRDMSLQEFYRQYPSVVKIEEVSIINEVEPDGTLKGGQSWKRVVGGSGIPSSK